MKDYSKKSPVPDPDERPKADLMKTQALFLLVRLFIFIAVIFIALLIVFTLVRKQAYSGSDLHIKPAAGETYQR
jgi:hypothetical protein